MTASLIIGVSLTASLCASTIAIRLWLTRSYNALRNSVGVTPTTLRKTCAKWLGLA